MELESLKDLFIDQLRDLYNAEKQLVKALPKMARAATNDELKQGFEKHLEETEGQVGRLEQIFDTLEERPTGKTCAAMKGLVEEGSEAVKADGNPAVIDAALIAAAQRVEHYEIAAYGTARAFAELLDMDDAAQLLQETLDEESATDKKLSEIAENTVNSEAAMSLDKSEDEEQFRPKRKTTERGSQQPRM